MVEALTTEERDDFIAEVKRLGAQRTEILLDRRGVKKISQLPRPDRITLLAEMRRAQGLKR